jgi:DNA polymerase III alpha subunit
MCQWMKVYHPYEFFIACLNNEEKLDKIEEYLVYMTVVYGLDIKVGDLNNFNVDFAIEDETIKVGMSYAKGLTDKALALVKENRPYSTIKDFFESEIDWRMLNKRKIETLINLRVFDGMALYENGPVIQHRNQMKAFYDGIRNYKGRKVATNDYLVKSREDKNAMWQDVYDGITVASPGFSEMAQTEIDLFGFHIIFNPLNYIERRFNSNKMNLVKPTGTVAIPGVVTRVKLWKDKSKREMAFLALKTSAGMVDVTVFAYKWIHLNHIEVGSSGIFFVKENNRGRTLESFHSVEPPRDLEMEG